MRRLIKPIRSKTGFSLGAIVIISLLYHSASMQALEREQIFQLPSVWGDASQYLAQSVIGYHKVLHDGWRVYLDWFMLSSDVRAPLFQHLCSLWYVVFGESLRSALWSQWLYLTLLLIALFLIGLTGFRSYLTGWAAVLITLGSPIIIAYSRAFMSELPLAALTTLSVLLLIRSAFLTTSDWRVPLALGVALGLCLLTKAMAPVYLLGPMGYGLVVGYRSAGQKRVFWTNVGLCLASTVLLAAIWWVRNLHGAISYLVHFAFGSGAVSPAASAYLEETKIFFEWLFLEDGLSIPFLIVLVLAWLLSLVSSLRHPRPDLSTTQRPDDWVPRRTLWCISAWFLVALFLHLSTHNKAQQFIVGLMPPLSVLSACYISRLRRSKTLCIAIMGLVVATTCFNFSVLTLGIRVPKPLQSLISPRDAHYQTLKHDGYRGATDPSDTNWHLKDLVEQIDTTYVGKRPVIAFLLDEIFFSPSGLRYFTAGTHDFDIMRFEPETPARLMEMLKRSDFLVAFADQRSYAKRVNQHFTVDPAQLQKRIEEGAFLFKVVQQWTLPNGLKISLYRKERVRISPLA